MEQQTNASVMDALLNSLSAVTLNYIDMLRRAIAENPAAQVVFEPDRESMTLAEFVSLTEKTVKELNAMGYGRASNIIVALPHNTASATAAVCLNTGFALLGTNPALQAEEYERYIKHIEAVAVVVEQDTPCQARQAARRLGIGIVEIKPLTTGPAGSFEVVGADELPDVAAQFSEPDDLASFILTSGTTTLPKMVPWTQRESVLRSYAGMSMARGSMGVTLVNLPLYHTSGYGPLVFSVMTGSGFTVLPAFDPHEVYRYLALYPIRFLFAVPAMLGVLLSAAPTHQAELDQLNLSGVIVSSAALPEPLLQEVQRVLRSTVLIGYGMTEAPLIAGVKQSTEDDLTYRAGSVGKPYVITEVQITDDNGAVVPTGTIGEIVIRSPMMFKGYYNNPEANALAFRAGWFRTGDAGYFDAEGFLYLTGRIKEIINRGGSKISPADIDAVLQQHPAVAEAAAFGFPHPALGEDVAAAIVLNDQQVTEAELRRFAAGLLPINKVPSRFVFVSALPKTALGKIQRNELSAQFAPLLQHKN